jgi:hypothetical protein
MSNEDGDGADWKRIESSQLARLRWVLHQQTGAAVRESEGRALGS